jgi:dihydropteroate synthase
MAQGRGNVADLLDLSRCSVMGVLNVTPDSFSDGGRYVAPGALRARVLEMLADELARVLPAIEAIRAESDVPISIDTSKPQVMREAVAAGANMINDVRALRADGALQAAAELGVAVCLMHMQGEPRSMQAAPQYRDVTAEVKDFLAGRLAACAAAGIPRSRLVVDPGFGFGKTLQHNLTLFRQLPALRELDAPLLVGVSRKSMIGTLLERPVDERLQGSVALATLACWMGAAIVRAHDVRATRDALEICRALRTAPEAHEGVQ